MRLSIYHKLSDLYEKYHEISARLSEPDVMDNQDLYRELSKEYARLSPFAENFSNYQSVEKRIKENNEWLNGEDKELADLAAEEQSDLETQKNTLEAALMHYLIPEDPLDESNIFLEIRAGTGGDEATLFAADLCKMYLRYAVTKGFSTEILSESFSPQGGYKEVVLRLEGKGAYSRFKFESGGHRVQRVPVTEASGRIHTSACTVAVLPEASEIEAVDIQSSDLRVDTFRASGAGGQHVNKTDSAIRITHLPTGMVVECQEERSQHKNRAKAMRLLQSRLLEMEREKQHTETSSLRKLLVGSGDRSQRIRTYNFPQGRLTDHRINLTLYQLESIIAGDLDPVIEPLIQEHHALALAQLGD